MYLSENQAPKMSVETGFNQDFGKKLIYNYLVGDL
jgi:hypothetical protein